MNTKIGQEDIPTAGALIDFLTEAAEAHQAGPHTPIYVRVGADGPLYSIAKMKGMRDQRGMCLILETGPLLGLAS